MYIHKPFPFVTFSLTHSLYSVRHSYCCFIRFLLLVFQFISWMYRLLAESSWERKRKVLRYANERESAQTRSSWVIYTQLSGTRVAINIFLIAWTLISKSIDVAFAEAVVVVVGPIVTAVTIAVVVDVGRIVPVADIAVVVVDNDDDVIVVLQLLLLFVKYEPSIKSWDGTFVVTDFSSKFFGRFSWPEYLMSYWLKRQVAVSETAAARRKRKRKGRKKKIDG